MNRIFKNLLPYWKYLIIIFVLLVGQAYCDLSLPAYTSDIIDTGIQNKGVEHILPEKMTAKEYGYVTMFMTEEEKELFTNAYNEKGGTYELKASEDKLEELDEQLLTPIVLTYNLANMSEASFRQTMKEQMNANEQTQQASEAIDTMTLEEIGKMMNVDLTIFEAEDENGDLATYVDMRPLMKQLLDSGMMSEESLLVSRDAMETMAEAIGSSTLSSMGIAYAISCDEAAGVDVDAVQIRYMWIAGGKMAAMAAVMLVCAILIGYFASLVGAGVGRDLRVNVFKRVVGFSNAEIDKFSTASLITRNTNDVQQIQMVSTMLLRMLMYAPILGVGGIVKVIKTGANMGWVIVLAVGLILTFVMVLMLIAMPKFKLMQKLVDRLNLVSREILTGIPVIRAFGREKKEEKRFDEANTDLMRTQLFTNRVMTFMMPGMSMIMYGVTLLIVWVAANRIDAGSLQVGAMTAFITYAMMIIMSFLMLTMMSIMLPRAGVAAERIDEVLKTDTSIKNKEQTTSMNECQGLVKFSNVNFRYPGAEEDVLSDINFDAKPGQTTAIIGSTGCGKSTLINLLPRFYDVTGGSITIDGVDVRDWKLEQLRDEIGLVPQKGVLFSGSIASNLRFGCPEADEETIANAASIAQAMEFIEEKTEGFESTISQGGTNVSGGQKQRLAIARAIAKNPQIFIFDDSFSALDMKTDAKLRAALAKQVTDSTVLIVAQRISTILHADKILVLDEGRIVGQGTHEELLKTCDVYQQIARSQLSAKELGIEEVAHNE